MIAERVRDGALRMGIELDAQACERFARYYDLLVEGNQRMNLTAVLEPEEAVKIIHRYGAKQVFFGTDYPMWKPREEVARFMALPLTEEERENILHRNFERFIGEAEA